MFALAIRYLTGFAAGSEPDSFERPEWPPHPGRVFLALAAAHFEAGGNADEQAALEWLENLDQAPAIRASDAQPRALVTHYVPVNDEAGPAKALLDGMALTRKRQPRQFARAWPDEDFVVLLWPQAEPSTAIRAGLAACCSRVARLGHSSCLVQCWLPEADEIPEPTWLPSDHHATRSLRVAGPGTLRDLEQRYNADAIDSYHDLLLTATEVGDKKVQTKAKKRLKQEYPEGPPPRQRPQLTRYQGYAPAGELSPESTAAASCFDPHLLVFTLERLDGPYRQLDLRDSPALCSRWRDALISQSNDGSAELRQLLSGHMAGSNAPLQAPHLSFVPLGFVGHTHADGHLQGLALALPRDLAPELRRAALRVCAKVNDLKLGRLGCWKLIAQGLAPQAYNLQPATWTAAPNGSTHWASVSPIVFDRHPKAKDRAAYQQEASDLIANACLSQGLPRPISVILTPASAHLGAPPAHNFPRLQRKDGSQRRHSHAILVFDTPVCGPLLLGAGRYRGYGLCRPLDGAAH